jgi:hypothetical protein
MWRGLPYYMAEGDIGPSLTQPVGLMSLSLATAKNALMTTAVVLLTIYVVRRTDMGKKLVTAVFA